MTPTPLTPWQLDEVRRHTCGCTSPSTHRIGDVYCAVSLLLAALDAERATVKRLTEQSDCGSASEECESMHGLCRRHEVELLTFDLAECYRYSGADPDGDDDAMLARHAVSAVKEFRRDSDQEAERLETERSALAAQLAEAQQTIARLTAQSGV